MLLRSTPPLACLAACPADSGRGCLASLLRVELPFPCVVHQWFSAESCVPADVKASYPYPFVAGSRPSQPACPLAGADPSTPFLPREEPRQLLEVCQLLDLRQLLEVCQLLEVRRAW